MTFFTRIVFVSTLAISLASHFTVREQVTGSRLATKQTSKFPLASKERGPGGEVSNPSSPRRGQREVLTKQSTPSEPSPPRRGQGEVETPMLSVNGEAQGTTYHIRYFDGKNRNLKKEIDSLLGDFDKCLSLYRPDSEISRFNKADSHRFESPYFYPVLKKSQEVFLSTQGAFDPTVMPLVEAYGFGPKKTEPNAAINIDSLLQFVGLGLVTFDSLSVAKKKHQVRLDFNGIAQGYSVDVVSRFLVEKGIDRFMVEIGGEIVCKGLKNEGKIWVTGIENPMKPGSIFSTVNLTDRAMTTAGNYRNHFEKDGQVYNHLINPRNGSMEQTSMLSVTVFAKDAMTADAYDTAFFVMGLDQTKAFVATQKDLDVYLIYHDGKGLQTYASGGIKRHVKELRQ